MTQMKPIPVKRGAAKQADIRVEQLGAECIIRKGRSGDVEYEYTFVESVDAPVEKGQFMGEYLVTLDGVEVFRSDIVAQDDISRMSFPLSLWYILAELVTM